LWEESVPGEERGEGEQLLRSEAGGPAYGVQTAYQSLVLRKQRLRPFSRLGNNASFYTVPDVNKKKIQGKFDKKNQLNFNPHKNFNVNKFVYEYIRERAPEFSQKTLRTHNIR
jgi:hypothetical protein